MAIPKSQPPLRPSVNLQAHVGSEGSSWWVLPKRSPATASTLWSLIVEFTVGESKGVKSMDVTSESFLSPENIHLFIHPFIHPSIYLNHPTLHPSTHTSTHSSIILFIQAPIYPTSKYLNVSPWGEPSLVEVMWRQRWWGREKPRAGELALPWPPSVTI